VTEPKYDDAGLRASLQAALAMSEQANEIAIQLTDLTGVARSGNDAIEVTVDNHGFMTGLRFAPGATANGVENLGAQVMSTLSRAIVDLQEKGRPIRAELAIDPEKLLAETERRDRIDELALNNLEELRAKERNERP
jgi:hypothetical protein